MLQQDPPLVLQADPSIDRIEGEQRRFGSQTTSGRVEDRRSADRQHLADSQFGR